MISSHRVALGVVVLVVSAGGALAQPPHPRNGSIGCVWETLGPAGQRAQTSQQTTIAINRNRTTNKERALNRAMVICQERHGWNQGLRNLAKSYTETKVLYLVSEELYRSRGKREAGELEALWDGLSDAQKASVWDHGIGVEVSTRLQQETQRLGSNWANAQIALEFYAKLKLYEAAWAQEP